MNIAEILMVSQKVENLFRHSGESRNPVSSNSYGPGFAGVTGWGLFARIILTQGKQGRYFRATRKLKYPELVSHITQRAAGREPLFIENNDYLWISI